MSTATLWPANVARLQELGVKFVHRRAGRDIEISPCPVCQKGRLLLHESEPMHFCLNAEMRRCDADLMSFEKIVAKLGGKVAP